MGLDKYIGKNTCVLQQGSSVIDMVLCRPDMFHCVNSFVVQDPNILSDHCVVNFELYSNVVLLQNDIFKESGNDIPYVYKWDGDKKMYLWMYLITSMLVVE